MFYRLVTFLFIFTFLFLTFCAGIQYAVMQPVECYSELQCALADSILEIRAKKTYLETRTPVDMPTEEDLIGITQFISATEDAQQDADKAIARFDLCISKPAFGQFSRDLQELKDVAHKWEMRIKKEKSLDKIIQDNEAWGEP